MQILDETLVEGFIKDIQQSGINQITLKPIRDKQDESLTQRIISSSLEKLEKTDMSTAGDNFFVGSVDFMVNTDQKPAKLYVLETNGGSSRGFSILPPDNWLIAYKGFMQPIDDFLEPPLVMIGHPSGDLLSYEKFFLAQAISEKINERFSCNLSLQDAKRAINEKLGYGIVLDSYVNILPLLSVKKGAIYFGDNKVSLLIGDGLARRHPDISRQVLKDELQTVIVNEIFHVTDDKSLTYLAISKAAKDLERFNIDPISFWRAYDRKKLKKTIAGALDESPQLIIKPHGGSGGSGIDVITKEDNIEEKIDSSIEHYHEKFGDQRNPFPYTVCERVKSSTALWRNNYHQFDIRVYVCKIGDGLMPLGALCRIAIEPFTGLFTKKSFVVNLSGYGGVDTSRGLGISQRTMELLNLSNDDFVNIFASSVAVMSGISKNYAGLKKEANFED
jgi:hypothetical protein